MLTRNHHPVIRGPINHEHIVIKYEPPTQAKSCAFDHMARSHDSDAGSTDSGRPPSLTEHKEKVLKAISYGFHKLRRLGPNHSNTFINWLSHKVSKVVRSLDSQYLMLKPYGYARIVISFGPGVQRPLDRQVYHQCHLDHPAPPTYPIRFVWAPWWRR